MVSKRRVEDLESSGGEETTHISSDPEMSSDEEREGTPSKRQRRDVNDDDPDMAMLDEEDVSDAELERRHEASMKEKATQQTKAGVAEMGIIQQVDLVNFLCHRNLTVKLIPQINFITGHNGSGKSAVLTAIAVGLGGKATSTGRGTGLKSFIKEGETAGEVTIRLKNEGAEAIDPHIYGKSIIITRHFNVSGASGFKIKSSLTPNKHGEGKLVSTSRTELARITDAMNIQVDNPLNVLTQDLSRKFISSSSAQEKYEFFLKGTQLQQLSEEYQGILDNINRTTAQLSQKSEAIPELRRLHKEACTRYDQAKDVVKQQSQLDKLIKELAWSHVHEKQKELERGIESYKEKLRQVEKIQKKMTECEAKLKKAEQEVMEIEQQLTGAKTDAGPQLQALRTEQETLNVKIRDLKSEKMDLESDATKRKGDADRSRREITRLTTKIKEEELKIQQSNDGTRAALENEIDNTRAARDAAQAALENLTQRRTQAESDKAAKDALMGQKEAEFNAKNNQRGQVKEQIQQLERALADKWSKYGQNIPQVLNMIERASWKASRPVGPLGDFVELRDRQWATPVKVAIGNLMSSWAVEHADDRRQLLDMLKQAGNPYPVITVARRDLFDFAHGEPHPNVPTIYRALDIRDEYVKRVLINVASIETLALAENLKNAEQLLRTYEIRNRVLTNDLLSVRRYAGGGGMTETMPDPGRSYGALFTGNESETRSRLAALQERQVHLVRELEQLNQEKVQLQRDAAAVSRLPAELHNERELKRREMNNLEGKLAELERRAKTSAPAEVSVFIEARENAENTLLAHEENIKITNDRLEALKEEMRKLQSEKQDLADRVERLQSMERDLGSTLTQASVNRAELQNELKGWEPKLATREQSLRDAEDVRKTLETEFTDWNDRAEESFGPRIERPRPSEQVKREKDKLTATIQQAEKKLGASADDLSAEVLRTKETYRQARAEIDDLEKLNLLLNRAMEIRMRRWREFRRHIAIRSKILFEQHLANRGFSGKIVLTHPDEDNIKYGTLVLKIRTDDQNQASSKEKDTKGLSGGEKSFSTLCLLMALWDAMGCPIRCLDEFDVFMDEVNRVVAMKMMIETARSSESRQFVLITPLGTKGVDPSPSIKIHRMVDPERGQTTLPYTSRRE
ncbi:P-loop containing nucleoside triphosphate hydrolase protein [Clavulina sp. PMI_390]|nr:P-loop containing nucleoside triphosphate hydrolase protein [Clavulina sp. PMI_390]